MKIPYFSSNKTLLLSCKAIQRLKNSHSKVIYIFLKHSFFLFYLQRLESARLQAKNLFYVNSIVMVIASDPHSLINTNQLCKMASIHCKILENLNLKQISSSLNIKSCKYSSILFNHKYQKYRCSSNFIKFLR